MEKLQQLYEGKAKKVFATDDPELLIVDYNRLQRAEKGHHRRQGRHQQPDEQPPDGLS